MNGRFWCKKRDVCKLRYGVIHSQVGFSDGVSIVMEQVEDVLKEHLGISEKNILYLVGKTKRKGERITEREVLWDRYKINRMMLGHFESGYGGGLSEKIEKAIGEAKEEIEKWVKEKKIDILIVHNSSHPVNFVSSVALSRFYRDCVKRKKKTPKYVLWWHDSHLEREHFSRPAADVEKYLLEGVPGRFVEHVIFINNLQLKEAKLYFAKIDKRYPGFYERMVKNYNVVYNTTNTFIDSFGDLDKSKNIREKQFMKDFGVRDFLKKRGLRLNDVLFCLQHTRIEKRKRIDFALKYCYEFLTRDRSHMIPGVKKKFRAIYFLVSGQHYNGRKELERLNEKLGKKYGQDVFLVFAEDFKTDISFVEYPRIFAKLGGVSTYFSEVEGFGNNLLEVLASGLIPIVYKYPVFRKDIEKYNFDLLALDDFEVRDGDLKEMFLIVRSKRKRARMVNRNLRILREHFPHSVISLKLMQAVRRKRGHC